MADYKSKYQSDVNVLETIRMGRKAPAVANRIFNTINEAQEYADNPNESATVGIRITVLQDWSYVEDQNGRSYGDDGYMETRSDDSEGNSGVYFIKTVGDGNNTPGELVKICRGTCAWFSGNAVDDDHTTRVIRRAQQGDAYLNTETLDIYVLNEDDEWEKLGNMVPQADQNRYYYIMSEDCEEHPTFSIDDWYTSREDAVDAASSLFSSYGQVYLWTRLYNPDAEVEEEYEKYTCALYYSGLNLGTF